MTVAAHRAPYGDERLRIAITSPDILAQIRRVFAGKNLDVDIVGMPYVEVAVRPAGTGRNDQPRKPVPAGRATAEGTAEGTAESTADGTAGPAVHHAEYRLSVIPLDEDRPDTVRIPEAGGREITLSQRQREVMTLMSRGARNAEIARVLHVTEKTVKNHINRIFRELKVDGRVEAVLLWQRHLADTVRRQGVGDQ